MAKYNEVECFMYYMYNRWNLNESKKLFGESLGDHIYTKWTEKIEYSIDRTMSWYGDLDKKCRDKLLERAKEIYGKD
jgi:hypothetical protein